MKAEFLWEWRASGPVDARRGSRDLLRKDQDDQSWFGGPERSILFSLTNDAPSISATHSFQKCVIFSNVVGRVVRLGSEDKQCSIAAVLPLPAPHHGSKVNTDIRL